MDATELGANSFCLFAIETASKRRIAARERSSWFQSTFHLSIAFFSTAHSFFCVLLWWWWWLIGYTTASNRLTPPSLTTHYSLHHSSLFGCLLCAMHLSHTLSFSLTLSLSSLSISPPSHSPSLSLMFFPRSLAPITLFHHTHALSHSPTLTSTHSLTHLIRWLMSVVR